MQAQRARPRFGGFGSDLTGAHAKINNAVQRLDSSWRILTEHLSDFNAWRDEIAVRLTEYHAAIIRHDEWHSEHVDELFALRRRLAALEADRHEEAA